MDNAPWTAAWRISCVVLRQRAFAPRIPFVAERFEHRAAGHAVLIHVQADGDIVVAGIADGVVLVRRNQTAGGAGSGLDRAGGPEAVAALVVFQQLVLHHFEFAAPDAFHAPHAVMIVDRRSLAGAPRHRHHAVAMFVAVVQLTARVVIHAAFENA